MGVIGTAAVVLEHDADDARGEHFRDDWLALHDAVAEYQRRWPLDAPVAWFAHGAPNRRLEPLSGALVAPAGALHSARSLAAHFVSRVRFFT